MRVGNGRGEGEGGHAHEQQAGHAEGRDRHGEHLRKTGRLANFSTAEQTLDGTGQTGRSERMDGGACLGVEVRALFGEMGRHYCGCGLRLAACGLLCCMRRTEWMRLKNQLGSVRAKKLRGEVVGTRGAAPLRKWYDLGWTPDLANRDAGGGGIHHGWRRELFVREGTMIGREQ